MEKKSAVSFFVFFWGVWDLSLDELGAELKKSKEWRPKCFLMLKILTIELFC